MINTAKERERIRMMFGENNPPKSRYLAALDVIDAQAAEIERLRSALKDTTAHLVAATSLLEDGGREAAASDKMFNTLIQDYHRGIDRARAALSEREP